MAVVKNPPQRLITGSRKVLGLWLAAMLLAALSFALRLRASSALLAGLSPQDAFFEMLIWAVLFPSAAPAFASLGAILLARMPRNIIGSLALALSLLISLQDIFWQYASLAFKVLPGSLALSLPAAWLSQILLALIIPPVPVVLILLRFPDGNLLSHRWRVVEWLAILALGVSSLRILSEPQLVVGLDLFIPNPTYLPGLESLGPLYDSLATGLMMFCLAAAVLSLVLRWRGARGIERKQIQWVAYISILSVANLAASLLVDAAFPGPDGQFLANIPLAIGVAGFTIGFPLAMGIAILRNRLYEIDFLINRTLVYSLVTIMLAMVYFGCVILLQSVLQKFAGDFSPLAVVASTLAIAGLFNPLRRRVQRVIDHRFYRSRYRPGETLALFAASLKNEVDLSRVSEKLLSVVDETLQPDSLSIWMREARD